jgi:hypothetical protein
MAADMPDLDPTGTRVLRRDAVETLAVIPTKSGGACLATMHSNGGAGRACTTATNPSVALVRYGQTIGLVPDGVDTISYRLSDGSVVQGGVVNNVYEAPADAAAATFAVGGSTNTVDLLPSGSLPKGAHVTSDGTIEIGAPVP